MDAIGFVKKFGLERAKREISYEGTMMQCNNSDGILDDLKQIVEAFELVESYGGLVTAKNCEYSEELDHVKYNVELAKAIELVEKVNASD